MKGKFWKGELVPRPADCWVGQGCLSCSAGCLLSRRPASPSPPQGRPLSLGWIPSAVSPHPVYSSSPRLLPGDPRPWTLPPPRWLGLRRGLGLRAAAGPPPPGPESAPLGAPGQCCCFLGHTDSTELSNPAFSGQIAGVSMETGAVRSCLLPETQGAGHCDQMVGNPPNRNLDLQISCLYEFSQKKKFS